MVKYSSLWPFGKKGEESSLPVGREQWLKAMQPTHASLLRTRAVKFAEGGQEEVDRTWQKQTKTFITVTQATEFSTMEQEFGKATGADNLPGTALHPG